MQEVHASLIGPKKHMTSRTSLHTRSQNTRNQSKRNGLHEDIDKVLNRNEAVSGLI